MDDTTPSTPSLRVARFAVLAVALVLAGIAALVVVRGTWAGAEIVDPATPADGAVTALHRTPDGRTEVRCAAVLAQPADRVWGVVTGYDRFPEVFGSVSTFATLTVSSVEREPDGRFRMRGAVVSRLGTWPVDARVRHHASSAGYVASWDEAHDGHVNRGSWTVTPLGPDRSLLVYSIEVHEPPYPDLLVNNVLLSELAPVVEAVGADIARQSPGT
jgi:hypothetical protein